MDAETEGEVVSGVAVRVEIVWVFEVAWITVRRGEQKKDACAGWDRGRTDGVVVGRGSIEPLHR